MHLRILLFQSKLSQLRRWHGKRPDHNAHDRHSHAHHLEALLRSKFRTKSALSRSVPSTRRFVLRCGSCGGCCGGGCCSCCFFALRLSSRSCRASLKAVTWAALRCHFGSGARLASLPLECRHHRKIQTTTCAHHPLPSLPSVYLMQDFMQAHASVCKRMQAMQAMQDYLLNCL